MPGSKLRIAVPLAVSLGIALVGGAAWVNASSSPPPSIFGVPQLNAAPLIGSTGVQESVSAFVTGAVDTVDLVVTDTETGHSSVVPMDQQGDDIWTGSIPSNLVDEANLIYRVDAELDAVSKSSPAAELVVLDNLRKSTPELVANTGETVLTKALGNGPNELGARGGNESARELPPSFAVDGEERIHVLDAIKSRVVTFDRSGAALSKFDLAGLTRTASDIFVANDGTTFVLDQTKDAIETIAYNGARSYKGGLGVRSQPLGALLAHLSESGTTYVREATQGRFLPILKNGREVSRSERTADARAGVPTPDGDLAVEVAGRSVTYALSDDMAAGYSLSFADQVLDAAETVVDGDGFIWSLVGTYDAASDGASMYLVAINPATGNSRMAPVGVSVPGDVTRRLVSAGQGVALMEGDGDTLSFVRFQTI